jgi:hypothetical protein
VHNYHFVVTPEPSGVRIEWDSEAFKRRVAVFVGNEIKLTSLTAHVLVDGTYEQPYDDPQSERLRLLRILVSAIENQIIQNSASLTSQGQGKLLARPGATRLGDCFIEATA